MKTNCVNANETASDETIAYFQHINNVSVGLETKTGFRKKTSQILTDVLKLLNSFEALVEIRCNILLI